MLGDGMVALCRSARSETIDAGMDCGCACLDCPFSPCAWYTCICSFGRRINGCAVCLHRICHGVPSALVGSRMFVTRSVVTYEEAGVQLRSEVLLGSVCTDATRAPRRARQHTSKQRSKPFKSKMGDTRT